MSCYVNMDELANFAEARNTPADITGGAGEQDGDAQGSDATHVGPALCPTCPTEPAAKSDKIPQNSASAEIDDDTGRNAELERLQQIEDEMEDHLFKETDCNLSGPKRSMGSAAKKMALMELHKRKGHAGHVPGCPVCLMCRKNVRKCSTTR